MLRNWNFTIAIDRDAPASLGAQIVQTIIARIQDGVLRPGGPLPGSRQLAAQLGVNRKTVIQAYEELVVQGWLTSEDKRGTFVSADLPAPLRTGTAHELSESPSDNRLVTAYSAPTT